jgi:hypothetical protein
VTEETYRRLRIVLGGLLAGLLWLALRLVMDLAHGMLS